MADRVAETERRVREAREELKRAKKDYKDALNGRPCDHTWRRGDCFEECVLCGGFVLEVANG